MAGTISAGCTAALVSPNDAADSGEVVDTIDSVQTGPGATALTRIQYSIELLRRGPSGERHDRALAGGVVHGSDGDGS